jgi:sugar lactone lactonase YvrE
MAAGGLMTMQGGRYTDSRTARVAEGWRLERLTPVSRLFGANGLRTGPDGRIYAAQATGSRISAIDIATGELETISPTGSDIIGPDDVAFDSSGNLYATEVMEGRVSVRGANGRTRVLRDDVPAANGITVYRDRLFVNECRVDGRLLELSLDGGPPRVLLENLPMPNAMEVGPDGLLYFPVLGANEIWRVNPEGGAAERVAGDLGVPDAVKFDPKGYIVSTQVHTGEVLCIDPRNGDRTVLASLDPGLDNLTFVGERLFVSHLIDGRITEILGGGATRALMPGGFNWPLDLAVDQDGTLYIADGFTLYTLSPDGNLRRIAQMFDDGFPRTARGIASAGGGDLIITTKNGQVARYRTSTKEHEILAEGYDQLYGVAIASDGAIIVAELGAGRVLSLRQQNAEVLATGLDRPTGVLIDEDGSCIVSQAGAGRISRLAGSRAETIVDDLVKPQGILLRDGQLYIVDVGAKSVIAFDMKSKSRRVLASDLPLGSPPGVIPKLLRGSAPFAGPLGPFAGIAMGSDGTLFFSADGEGCIMALRPDGP